MFAGKPRRKVRDPVVRFRGQFLCTSKGARADRGPIDEHLIRREAVCVLHKEGVSKVPTRGKVRISPPLQSTMDRFSSAENPFAQFAYKDEGHLGEMMIDPADSPRGARERTAHWEERNRMVIPRTAEEFAAFGKTDSTPVLSWNYSEAKKEITTYWEKDCGGSWHP